MLTRRCTACGEDKTIRGVWYMMPPSSGTAGFVCEGCMTHRAVASPA